MNLQGRFALITGASRGLGAEIARQYVANGASVFLTARSIDKLEGQRQTLLALAAPEARVVIFAGDVGVEEDVDAMFANLNSEFGRLDIVVNNAGIYGPMGRVEDIDWNSWVEAIRVNLVGLVYVTRTAMPRFRAQRYGKIINVSGGGASNPMPRSAPMRHRKPP